MNNKTEKVMKKKFEFNRERHNEVKDSLRMERTMCTLKERGLLESFKDPVTGETRYRVTEEGLQTPDWSPN